MNNIKKHIFALVDCNNFYASCERVFNPAIEKKPVVIMSNNDGCAVAMSNEAKTIGIKIGTPIFQMQELVKKYDIQVYSSNYALYGDMSSRVMNVISEFSPTVEFYSIDESFLLLDGINCDMNNYGRKIKKTVKQWTGIPVSVGIAGTKTLAKIANRIAKKDAQYNGVLDLTAHADIDDFLKKVAVEDVWGVGWQNTKKLNNYGIHTALELKNAPDPWIRQYLGGIVGLRTIWELRGISCITLELVRSDKKQIISSRSFGKMVTSIDGLIEAVSTYTTRAAEKLRRQNSLAAELQLFIGTNRFKDEPQYFNTASYSLPNPTSYTPELISHAVSLLQKIYREGFRYKKAGIVLSEIIPEKEAQESLFFNREAFEKKAGLMDTVDRLNTKYGSNTLTYASSGLVNPWQMRRESLSFRYTTHWNEIPVVFI